MFFKIYNLKNMKFIRTKKLVFFNNKGGVGKTTLAYNSAVKFAEKGYKTVLIDLDPQCNLSSISLGRDFLEKNLFSSNENDIYGVLKGIIEGGSDVNTQIQFQKVSKNLSILPGNLKLSNYENSLIASWGEAAQGVERGFFSTSAIDRFLNKKGLDEEIDIFIIDTSPSLGLLNRIIFLGADYFITPLMPDAFSVQGIENLGSTFENWKNNWKKTARVLAKDQDIASSKVLDGEGLFIGYIINSYNQYSQKPIKTNEEWIKRIPEFVKKHLSEKHCRNGLVESSWKNPISLFKNYGQLSPLAQMKNKAIFNLQSSDGFDSAQGTKENLEQSKKEFEEFTNKVISILEKF
jgi:chromosome partitioning protein